MPGAPADPRRSLLLELFRVALAAVDGRRRMRAALAADRDHRPASVLAAGKAAAAMMLGARDALGDGLQRGLLVMPEDADIRELAGDSRITCVAGGHPLPDGRSLAAGAAACEFAAATAPGSHVLLLVSGGASALLEVLAPGVTLADLRERTARAQADGSDIVALNSIRRAASLVKGGQLAARFRHASLRGYFVSDVPGDDPALVGSGLLAWPGCEVTCVGCLDDALDAVLRAARSRGLSAAQAPRLSGDAAVAARDLCHEHAICGAELLVAGGETVVRLPPRPGRGGRCQHLALAAAGCIAGHADLVLLAAGTDGRDGASEDAGAIVDGGTLERAADGGCDAAACLDRADSGSALEASGDLVHTGATGTNVGDIVLLLRQAPAAGDAR